MFVCFFFSDEPDLCVVPHFRKAGPNTAQLQAACPLSETVGPRRFVLGDFSPPILEYLCFFMTYH